MSQTYPIVYVRGYAMTPSEVEATFNMPYYGFNLGSTQFKLSAAGRPKMHIFESPVVRLIKEEGYVDAFNRFVDSQNLPIPDSVSDQGADWRTTLWIFRYYDPESKMFGGDRPEIEAYAANLARFLAQVRQACGNPDDFAVDLVAHSMGGLVCRCYLQNPEMFDGIIRDALGDESAQDVAPVTVDKLFTFGTPHRGIGFRRGLGWAESVRDLVGAYDSDVFGEKRMRKYLGLGDAPDVNIYRPQPHAPGLDHVFCLVGTNHEDYTVTVSKLGVGPGSDGLVLCENAYVQGAPRAYVHRAHSGPLGMVNSEEGYQNLRRFLFGDHFFQVRLDVGTLHRDLPRLNEGDEFEYLLIEVDVVVRGLPNYVHTRRAEHLSAMVVPMRETNGGGYVPVDSDTLVLFTGYLRSDLVGVRGDPRMRCAVQIRIEPHYRHDGFIRDSRYEGEWILNERLHLGFSSAEGEDSLDFRWGNASEDQPAERVAEGFVIAPPESAKHFFDGMAIRTLYGDWRGTAAPEPEPAPIAASF